MSALSACPVCREVLAASTGQAPSAACPACGIDLTPYIALHERTQQYISLIRELLSRGQCEEAGTVLEQLAAITEIDPAVNAELQARLQLAAGQPGAAAAALVHCDPGTQAELAPELLAQQQLQQSAYELYNYALTAARRGEFRLAADQAQRAVVLAPRLAPLWLLKLKADIKCGFIARCYDDLRMLDELNARPAQFELLERLLPPVA